MNLIASLLTLLLGLASLPFLYLVAQVAWTM